MRLILASASPRRAELLRSAGYSFEVVVADVDESIRAGESPSGYVRRLAADKSAAAMVRVMADLKVCSTLHAGFSPADVIVLGADTTVVADGAILGKPLDEEDGRRMLQRLSGATHQVLTGVSLRQGSYEVGRVETSSVTFRALTDEDIAWYLASGEWRGKAGGYAIQGFASRFIPSMAGSYSNVVGLPLACVDELMRSLLASRP
jgi:septum formation protein